MNPKSKFLFLRIKNKVFTLLGKTHYYTTEYGVKVFNRKSELTEDNNCQRRTVEYSPTELFLGIDGLKDQYSSTGIEICKSPHYNLVSCSEKGFLCECDYIKREQLGSLDGRDTVYYEDDFHLDAYKRQKASIENGYKPVTIYTINGIHYIADGKHRAAVLALLGRTISCIEVRLSESTLIYMRNIYKLMLRDREAYSKNISLIEDIFFAYKEDLL